MKIIKRFIKWVLNLFRPLVERLAGFYGIEVRKSFTVYGQNKLIFEDELTSRARFIPKSTYFNTRSGNIFIGKNSMFGENVMVVTGKHMDISESKRTGMPLHHVPAEGRDIHIGKHCFIGSGAIILGKVTLGDYSVVGAGSVVTKDVPERVFAAGVPAKVVKQL